MANPFAFKFITFLLIPKMFEDDCLDIPTVHVKVRETFLKKLNT